MESFKQQVQAVQMCQSALQVPEEVMANLAICRTALRLQQEASQLQHVAIQQCNILQVNCVNSRHSHLIDNVNSEKHVQNEGMMTCFFF